jgi:hypothetical protein
MKLSLPLKLMENPQKSNKRLMVRTITGRQIGKAKRFKLFPLVVGSYLTHSPFNVACKQIVKSNRRKTSLGPVILFCKISFPVMHLMPYYAKTGDSCPLIT